MVSHPHTFYTETLIDPTASDQQAALGYGLRHIANWALCAKVPKGKTATVLVGCVWGRGGGGIILGRVPPNCPLVGWGHHSTLGGNSKGWGEALPCTFVTLELLGEEHHLLEALIYTPVLVFLCTPSVFKGLSLTLHCRWKIQQAKFTTDLATGDSLPLCFASLPGSLIQIVATK